MKIQQTVTVTIDDILYEAAKLPPKVQEMIAILDIWRQDEIDQRVALSKTQAALRDLQTSIVSTVRELRAPQSNPPTAETPAAE